MVICGGSTVGSGISPSLAAGAAAGAVASASLAIVVAEAPLLPPFTVAAGSAAGLSFSAASTSEALMPTSVGSV